MLTVTQMLDFTHFFDDAGEERFDGIDVVGKDSGDSLIGGTEEME